MTFWGNVAPSHRTLYVSHNSMVTKSTIAESSAIGCANAERALASANSQAQRADWDCACYNLQAQWQCKGDRKAPQPHVLSHRETENHSQTTILWQMVKNNGELLQPHQNRGGRKLFAPWQIRARKTRHVRLDLLLGLFAAEENISNVFWWVICYSCLWRVASDERIALKLDTVCHSDVCMRSSRAHNCTCHDVDDDDEHGIRGALIAVMGGEQLVRSPVRKGGTPSTIVTFRPSCAGIGKSPSQWTSLAIREFLSLARGTSIKRCASKELQNLTNNQKFSQCPTVINSFFSVSQRLLTVKIHFYYFL